MAVTISLAITQNSQNVTNNTSNVTVKATVKWTYGSWNATGECYGSITIDGTKYSFSGLKFNTSASTSGSQVIMTKTVNVKHGDDGTKKLSCSTSFYTGVSSGTVTASASKTLTTIPRKSELSAPSGTLGVSHVLSVIRQSTSFTHSIKAVCGSSTLYIKADGTTSTSEVKHSECQIQFTPPLSWASQNTTGTTVSVKYTITTYSGSTNIGSNSYTKNFAIPTALIPKVSLAVSDSTGHKDTFGAYVQGQSKMKIVATASGVQGSTIKSYKTTADGKTYTAASVTTGAIAGKGTLTIKTTVTDSRGRTASASTTISVLAYSSPTVSALSVFRCDADGNASSSGAYLGVKFSAAITPLNNKNSATYSVQFKKITDTEYTTIGLTEYGSQFSVSDGFFVFPAETTSSYDIVLTATDDFTYSSRTAVGSSAKKLWSMLKKAGEIVGHALGKIAELEGVFEIAFQTRFTGGILHPVLEPETDLNDVRTPNTYIGANVSTYNYGNCPLTSGTFTLEVVGMGEDGQVKQRLTYCHKTASKAWERIYYSSSWGGWFCVSDFKGQLLASPGYYMTGDHVVTLPQKVSEQPNGIVLVFGRYTESDSDTYSWQHFFIPKYCATSLNGSGHTFILTTGKFAVVGTKYLYINDASIWGHVDNNATGTANGITYNNGAFVLKHVIGV